MATEPDRDTPDLLVRWRDGDEEAASLLYREHYARVFGLARGLLAGDRQHAEEVAHIALTYAVMNAARFDPERARFTTWLHLITVSRCRDHQRRSKRPWVSLWTWLSGGNDRADRQPTPEATLGQHELQNEVFVAVQALEPELREVIVLRFWAGHSYREIADIVGCPLRTAQSRVRTAYGRLRGLLPGHEDGFLRSGAGDE